MEYLANGVVALERDHEPGCGPQQPSELGISGCSIRLSDSGNQTRGNLKCSALPELLAISPRLETELNARRVAERVESSLPRRPGLSSPDEAEREAIRTHYVMMIVEVSEIPPVAKLLIKQRRVYLSSPQ